MMERIVQKIETGDPMTNGKMLLNSVKSVSIRFSEKMLKTTPENQKVIYLQIFWSWILLLPIVIMQNRKRL